jgi:hypothetical protein
MQAFSPKSKEKKRTKKWENNEVSSSSWKRTRETFLPAFVVN